MYGGHAVISIGHNHPVYTAALAQQLGKIGFYSNSVKIEQQEKLAKRLGKLSGYEDYSLFLCNSGAEANENAFKLASFLNKRKKIVAFKGSFHGRTSLAVAATDNATLVAPVNQNEKIIFLPLNDQKAIEENLDEDVCAVIVEGTQGVAGIQVPDPDFLQALEKRCKAFGIVLILDEIQSGYGRTGKFFAHQHSGIRPDLITVAKGMGNGFPVAGLLISPEFKAEKEQLGTTFGGNYLACVAALSVLEVLENENLIENAAVTGELLKNELNQIAGIRTVRANGLMIGIELEEPVSEKRQKLVYEHGLFTGSAANKNTIRLLPALNIGPQQVDECVTALKQVLA